MEVRYSSKELKVCLPNVPHNCSKDDDISCYSFRWSDALCEHYILSVKLCKIEVGLK